MDQIHDAIGEAGGEIRAEINRAVFLQPPRHVDARIALRECELDVRIGLVIAQQDVVAGLVLFDEVVFKRHRLLFVFDDDGLEVRGDFEHPIALDVGGRRLLEIRPHARPKRLGLADVNRPAGMVLENINAGQGGQVFGLAAAILVHRGPPRHSIMSQRAEHAKGTMFLPHAKWLRWASSVRAGSSIRPEKSPTAWKPSSHPPFGPTSPSKRRRGWPRHTSLRPPRTSAVNHVLNAVQPEF